MKENELSYQIIGSAMQVHRELGPGLLENSYKECLNYELNQSGLFTQMEKAMPLVYKGIKLDLGYRLDIIVEKSVLIEIKSVQSLNDVHLAQMISYLRLGNFKLGLLINFNVSNLMQGVKRVVNQL